MLNLNFNGNLLFNGFLPETRDDGIEFNLEDGKYNFLLFLADREKQLSYLDISNIPTDPEQLKKYINLSCNGLSMEIRISDIDPDILSALDEDQPTEKINLLKQEIYKIVLDIHGRIIDYFRDVKKQYWLEPLDLDSRNYQSFLDDCGIVWFNSNVELKKFPSEKSQTIYFNSIMPDENQGVNEKDWKQLSSFITKNKPAKMRDVLIANSFKHLSQNNGRLAVVEAVIAFESVLKQLLPKVILRLPGTPQIEEKQIDKVLEKTGLRAITEVVLKLIMVPVGLNDDDINTVINAIEERNLTIHNSQRTIDIKTAWKYVNTIQKVIGTFENWATKKVS
jgi:hypothetical protein